jgi:transcription elongation factor Elf1
MTRRRKREVKVFHKQIPEIFFCPRCGAQAVSVKFDKKDNIAYVSCGSCSAKSSYPLAKAMAPVDAYNKFVDALFEKTVT